MAETKREWTNQELVEYISRFKDVQREYVLKQLLEVDLLAKFLATTEGRLIINKVVDGIANETMSIVSLAISGGKTAEIEQAALRINVAYDFMYALAKIASEGGAHKENMKKK